MTQRLQAEPGDIVKWDEQGNVPAEAHVYDEDSIHAINAALAARRPLLVRGEPGTGKSQLARAAACSLRRPLLSKVIDHRTTAQDLRWTFDAVARLGKAQLLGALGQIQGSGGRPPEDMLADELDERSFLQPGPLWWALDWESAKRQANWAAITKREKREASGEQPEELVLFEPEPLGGWEKKAGAEEPVRLKGRNPGTVVLIDEIDKADSDVPNGLLECLGQRTFTPPGYTRELCCTVRSFPLVIITTNEERALPDPFLRRCLVLHLELPDDRDELIELLMKRGRAHFDEEHAPDKTLEAAADLLFQDRGIARSQGLSAPGQAEYLDLVRAVVAHSFEGELDPQDQEELIRKQKEILGLISKFALKKHPRIASS